MGAYDVADLVTLIKEHPKGSEIIKNCVEGTKRRLWVPNPGSQSDAYASLADETGYGGEAGPGKTDLLVGLSLTEHHRSLVLRRTNKEASKLVDRFEEILGSREGFNGQESIWRVDGRVIDISGCQLEIDKQKWKGNPHDLIAFDEVVDFTESQYTFIIGWNRSTTPGQRCRVVCAFNPPTEPMGLWVLRRFAPWLDPTHPKPAASGELRYFTTIDEQDTEVDGPEPINVNGEMISPKSRTFIRGHLEENPDLAGTGYQSTLAAMPEQFRTAYMKGSFEAALRDQPGQLIPTAWVLLAKSRWTPRPPEGIPQCAIGVDATGGGKDPLMLAIRHDGWYDKMIEVPGKEVPLDRIGSYCAGVVVSYRRDDALVVVDLGGGYGGSTAERLQENGVDILGYKGAEKTERRSHDRKLRFTNVRTAAYWLFREALDPGQPGGSPIALPDDSELVSDLTALTFESTPNGIKAEPKEQVCERLGRSTDKGDAVVMAWWGGPKEINSALEWADQKQAKREHLRRGQRGRVIVGRENSPLARRR